MASPKRGFLVGRLVEGTWHVASKTGYLYPGVGACHPLVDGMTETDHDTICKAVSWMAEHPGVTLVDLTAINLGTVTPYRVSWR